MLAGLWLRYGPNGPANVRSFSRVLTYTTVGGDLVIILLRVLPFRGPNQDQRYYFDHLCIVCIHTHIATPSLRVRWWSGALMMIGSLGLWLDWRKLVCAHFQTWCCAGTGKSMCSVNVFEPKDVLCFVWGCLFSILSGCTWRIYTYFHTQTQFQRYS